MNEKEKKIKGILDLAQKNFFVSLKIRKNCESEEHFHSFIHTKKKCKYNFSLVKNIETDENPFFPLDVFC